MKEHTQISILGCGWLGFPLAKKLIAEGFQVNGSTTTREKLTQLESEHINAFQIELTENGVSGKINSFLNGSEILIVDIPPGLRRNPSSDFTAKMSCLLDEVEESQVKRLLFISSTSVFQDTVDFPVYTESDRPNGEKENARQLQEVEEMVMGNTKFTTTVLRFGGLCGEDRHPVKYLSGRQNISNPKAPVNLIHQKDCMALIEKIIESKSWGKTFHGVFPEYPSRETYYIKAAKQRQLKPPQFSTTDDSKGKTISSVKTQELLDFNFQHKP